ncbi:MAG TPA: GT-D fold domain-containing glycosyltransferase [Flavobacterium sp.]|jgi:glycosyltransferase family protein
MSFRYSKTFQIPRKIFKRLLSLSYPLVTKLFPLPIVRSIEETLDRINSEKCSISRFGDGEFLYIIDKLNLPFQKYDTRLAEKMKDILISEEPNILVGLPIGYHSLHNLKRTSQITWRSQIAWIYPRLKKYLKPGKTYYNASMTRVYSGYEDKSCSKVYFEKLMQIWEGREVLLIEGEKSRLGSGNNLFSKALGVQRVLAPMHHAFDQYDALVAEAMKHDKSKLLLIALGPTATALSYDLAKLGYQAVDIGNVDIEYEWYLRGASEKVKIEGKYTSEAIGGRNVADIVDPLYESQIIARYI